MRPLILVCEDDLDIAHLIKLMLDKGGFDSDMVYRAAQAMEQVVKRPYAAMTVDLGLPDLDGISLIRALRHEERTRDLPIVVVSANAEAGELELNNQPLAVSTWLEKPIDENKLILSLQRAIANMAEGRPRILHVEDDLDIQRTAATIAQDFATFEFAGSLQEAREQLAKHHYDLVLLDLTLKDGSGWELLDTIEALNPAPPVVVFSASDAVATETQRVEAVLVKAYTSNNQLLRTLQRVLDESLWGTAAPTPDDRPTPVQAHRRLACSPSRGRRLGPAKPDPWPHLDMTLPFPSMAHLAHTYRYAEPSSLDLLPAGAHIRAGHPVPWHKPPTRISLTACCTSPNWPRSCSAPCTCWWAHAFSRRRTAWAWRLRWPILCHIRRRHVAPGRFLGLLQHLHTGGPGAAGLCRRSSARNDQHRLQRPMRAALAKVRDADGLALSGRQHRVRAAHGGTSVVEKKAELPLRWLRSMVAVQAYQAAMRKVFEMDAIPALRFCAACPEPPPARHRSG